SVNFDTTENLYIEGDNLEVLKLLQETYLGKIKMIYIDPPYNTGNDFVYEDDFAQDAGDYIANSGQYDDNGNRLAQNTESNGRFHTDWLNMIYPRLKLAKDLLTDDGVIFISIDDNEVDNLRIIGDEVFGALNFIGQTVRVSSPTQNISKFISIMHDYTLIWCKNKNSNNGDWKVKKNNADEFESRAKKLLTRNLTKEEIETELRELVKYPRFYDFDHYTQCDSKGVYQLVSMGGVENGNVTTQLIHPLTHNPCTIPQGGWRYKEDILQQLIDNEEIYYGKDESYIPRKKLYLHDYLYQIPKGINFFDTQSDVRFLKENKLPFDFPKPKDYIKYFIEMIGHTDDSIILDFFSGSATTAHAVMQLNAEDNARQAGTGNRKFIMVQLPEETDEKSEAYKAGYKNICEIGKERIRRAGEKIKNEYQIGAGFEQLGMNSAHYKDDIMQAGESAVKGLDVGFRVLKCDSGNMKDVYYSPADYEPSLFSSLTDNIKENRTPEDLLFQVMLDLGVLLSSKIEETTIAGKKVFSVADGYLIACFDENITDETIKEIAQKKPYYFVMRDGGYASDSVATNFDQIFAAYSPSTIRKVL
ncbi:MAG TPA: site-specific DNA-methyltransferase, partial [Spirochaetales bacterium]|nr:site-specific DNA-methyltransferase [Spirochaetales bacterium]